MELKVNTMQQIQQTATKSSVTETDGSFRFALLSSIEEQAREFHPWPGFLFSPFLNRARLLTAHPLFYTFFIYLIEGIPFQNKMII